MNTLPMHSVKTKLQATRTSNGKREYEKEKGLYAKSRDYTCTMCIYIDEQGTCIRHV